LPKLALETRKSLPRLKETCMMKHGWNESDRNYENDADGITEPLLELAEYDEEDVSTLPWLPLVEHRPPARR
jgi:hypothetical protein